MSSKLHMTEDQLFLVALAHETSKCDLPLEDFILNVHQKFEDTQKAYKSIRNSSARVGNKSKLGI